MWWNALIHIAFPPIAQLAEQLPLKETVPGSSPGGRTKINFQMFRPPELEREEGGGNGLSVLSSGSIGTLLDSGAEFRGNRWINPRNPRHRGHYEILVSVNGKRLTFVAERPFPFVHAAPKKPP